MTRSQPSLSIRRVASIAISIVAMSLSLGATANVQACPFADGYATVSAVHQLGVSDPSVVTRLPDNSKQQSPWYTELAGVGAIAGLFAIALLYNVRRSHAVAAAEVAVLSQHPHFEHPELTLTSIPQEALPSVFETEAVFVR